MFWVEIFCKVFEFILRVCPYYYIWITLLLLLLLLLLKHFWDPLITKWFFSLHLRSKNENARSIYSLFTQKTIIKTLPLKVRIKIKIELKKLRLKIGKT